MNAAADQYTVTWCGVRGFDSTRVVTAQATLLPGGAIEMKYGDDQPGRVGGRPVARAHRGLPGGQPERQRTDGRRPRRGRRALRRAEPARSRRADPEVLPDARRQLRSAGAVDRLGDHPGRLRLRDDGGQRDPRHRRRRLRRLARFRQRRPAAQPGGDGLARQVSRRSDAEVPRREQHASACSARRSATAGWPSSSSATAPARPRRRCSAARSRTGASSSTPTRR